MRSADYLGYRYLYRPRRDWLPRWAYRLWAWC